MGSSAVNYQDIPEGFTIQDDPMVKTKTYEGFRPDIYKDTVGKRTIGYGYNIDDPTVARMLPPDVVSGKRSLKREEADIVFPAFYDRAKQDAANIAGPDVYSKLPAPVLDVVNDMSYNLGATRLSGFKKAIGALKTGDYKTFGEEIKNSKWYKQTGDRSKEHYQNIQKYLKEQPQSTSSAKDLLSSLNPFNTPDASADEVSYSDIPDGFSLNQDAVAVAEPPKSQFSDIPEGFDIAPSASPAPTGQPYTGDTPSNWSPIDHQKVINELKAGLLGAGEIALSRTDLYKDPEVKNLLQEHPIAKAVGESARDLALLVPIGRLLEGVVAVPFIPKLAQGVAKLAEGTALGKRFLNVGEATRYVAKAVHSGATFGTLQAVKEAGIEQPDQNAITVVQHIVENTLWGAGLGITQAAPNYIARVATAGTYGGMTTAFAGGSPADVALNTALFGGFELLGGKGVDRKIKLQAMNNMRKATADYLVKGGTAPEEAVRMADQAMNNSIKQAGGIDSVMDNNSAPFMNHMASEMQKVNPVWELSKPKLLPDNTPFEPTKPAEGAVSVETPKADSSSAKPDLTPPAPPISTGENALESPTTDKGVSEPGKMENTQPTAIETQNNGIAEGGQMVFNDIKDQLMKVGYPKEEAEANAKLWEARATQAAQTQGISIQDWHAKNGPIIKGGEEAPSPQALNQKDQSLSEWTSVLDSFESKEDKIYHIQRLKNPDGTALSDAVKGRLIKHYDQEGKLYQSKEDGESLFHETGSYGSGLASSSGDASGLNVSTDKDLALGQGGKGIIIEFDKQKLLGKNGSLRAIKKPGTEFIGQKEFTLVGGFHDPTFVKSVTIKPNAKMNDIEARRLKRMFPVVEKLSEGTVILRRENKLRQGGQEPRGWVELKTGEKPKIVLAAKKDASTFIHESAHIWLHDMHQFSRVNKSNRQAFQDWGALIDWLEIKPEQTTIRRDQHEQFARGFEAYLREGKAPSEGLKAIFEKFKEWLMNIYKSIKDLKVTLNDEVRGVFDRMLAANEKMGNKGSVPNQRGEPPKEEKPQDVKLFQEGKKPQYSEQGKKQIREIADLLNSSSNAQLIKTDEGYTRLGSGWPEFLSDRGYTREELSNLFDKALTDKPLTDKQLDKLDGIMADYRADSGINPPVDIGSTPTAGDEGQAEKEKERKFITNVKEAEKTSPEVARQIESFYEVIGNEKTLAEAKNIIAKDINEAQQMVDSNEVPTRVSNTVALLLIDKAQAEGRFEDAKRIVEHTAQRNTAVGQTIQALAMYRRLTPTGILRYAERVIRQAEDKQFGGPGKRPEGHKTKFDKVLAEELTKRAKALGEAPQWEMPSTPEAKHAIQFLIDSFYKLGADGRNALPAEVKNALQLTIAEFQKLGVAGENTPERRNAMQKVFEEFQKLGVAGENTPMGKGIQEFLNVGYSWASRNKSIETALMLNAIAKRVEPSILRKISMGQIIAQLIDSKTSVRNVLGNLSLVPFENLADVIGTSIDISASLFTGKRTMWLPDPKTQLMGFYQGLREGTQEALLGINLKKINSKFDLPQDTVFDSGVLGFLEKSLKVLLGAPDRAFYQAAFNDSIRRQMKGLNENSLTPEMIEIAHYEGLYRTFQDRTALSDIFEGLKNALNAGKEWGFGDAVLKYAKTPALLLSRGIEYSPFGFVNTAFQILKPAMPGKYKRPFNQYKFVHSSSRALTGSVLLVGVGALLASLGIITGRSDKDKDVKSAQSEAGIKAYQINLSALKRFIASGLNKDAAQLREGDAMVSYDWMQPAAIGLAMGANMYLAKDKNKVDAAINLADRMVEASNTITEQPLMTGLKTMTSQRSLPEGVFETLKGIPASFVPSFLNKVRQITDNVSRNAKESWWKEALITRPMNKLPVLSKQLPANVTPLGKPREMYQGGSNNPFNVFLNPAFASKYQPDATTKFVLDIWKRSGHTEQFPRVQSKSVSFGKENVELNASQMFLYQTYIGERTDILFKEKSHDPAFMRASDDKQAKVLQNLLSDIKADAKRKFFDVDRDQSKGLAHRFKAIKVNQ